VAGNGCGFCDRLVVFVDGSETWGSGIVSRPG
jgi:hypothetical protein